MIPSIDTGQNLPLGRGFRKISNLFYFDDKTGAVTFHISFSGLLWAVSKMLDKLFGLIGGLFVTDFDLRCYVTLLSN